jgi:Xaa-Pro aminopeptidase
LLAAQSADALIVSSSHNLTYLSGYTGDESWGFISERGAFLITDSRYAEQAQNQARDFKIVLRQKRELGEIISDLAAKTKSKVVGFEAALASYAFVADLRRKIKHSKLKPIASLVEKLREIKDSYEIQKIRKSADLAVRGFKYIRNIAKAGLTERELEAKLDFYLKSKGGQKPAFDTIIASGAGSSMPHYQTGAVVVRNHQPLLIDMGVMLDSYCSDLTRTIFLGRMPPSYRKICGIVAQAQLAAIWKTAPGVPVREVDLACRKMIKKSGYGRYFGHGTGHGVGLQVHEAPRVSFKSSDVLKPGMVITIEPGIYLPGRFGVRIEDMVLVTEKGREVLTAGLDD